MQHLGDLVADALDRVQRHRGVLRDDADVAATDGLQPALAEARRSMPSKRDPRRRTICAAGASSPAMAWAVVDLPEPDSPTSASVSPTASSRSTPRTAADEPVAVAVVDCQSLDLEQRRRRTVRFGVLAHGAYRWSRAWAIRLAASTVAATVSPGSVVSHHALAQEVAPGRHQRTPLGRRGLGAVAEEAQRGDGEDGDAELAGSPSTSTGPAEFGSTWRPSTRTQLAPPVLGGLDERALADTQHLRAHDPGARGDAGQADGETDVEGAEAEDGDQRQGEQQARDRQDDVDTTHQDVVEPAADEPGDEADQPADDEADDNRQQRRAQGEGAAVHGAGEQVAAELVGAEQMIPRRRLQLRLRLGVQRPLPT